MEHKRKRGQAVFEYIIVFVALLGVVSILVFLLRAASRSSKRTTTLICSEYP